MAKRITFFAFKGGKSEKIVMVKRKWLAILVNLVFRHVCFNCWSSGYDAFRRHLFRIPLNHSYDSLIYFLSISGDRKASRGVKKKSHKLNSSDSFGLFSSYIKSKCRRTKTDNELIIRFNPLRFDDYGNNKTYYW